jgi:7-carboxy-7-deazaguanine synthase
MPNRRDRTLQVTEIYKSIQGESTYAGLPCAFVRLTGCNLRCTYCDTEYAFYGGTPMTIRGILQRVKRLKVPLVEVTGGEPLLQPDCRILVEELIRNGYTVLIETGGSIDVSPLPKRAVLIFDIKCPGSGMSHRMRWENLQFLKPTDQIKFVVTNRSDFLWSLRTIRKYSLAEKCPLLMSAAHPRLKEATLAEWILKSHAPVRLNVQIHKHIWDPAERGR